VERREDHARRADLVSDLNPFIDSDGGQDMAAKRKTTSLTPTSEQSRTLRTTIPIWIVDHFGLEAGDRVEWSFEVKDGNIIVVMSPSGGEDLDA
jgi:hypothetical protein